MPESRKKQSRADKTYSSKKNTKKIMNNVGLKPIYKQPVWSADEQFAINGQTLEFLANFVAPYRTLIQTVDSIMASGELEGKIGIEFFYEDRTVVPVEDERLAGLKETEEKRLAHWRNLVEAKQEELSTLAEKAQFATDAMDEIDITKNGAEVVEDAEVIAEGKEIPFAQS